MLTTARRLYFILTLLSWVSLVPLREVRAQAVSQTNRYGRGRTNAVAPAANSTVTRGPMEVPVYNPFQLSPLTLTGTPIKASSQAWPLTLGGAVIGPAPTVSPQTEAELNWAIEAALRSKNYQTLLQYATMNSIKSPEVELRLLKLEALALMKLHRIPDAIAALRYALIREPNDLESVHTLGELLLINGQISEYRTFASKHKEQIDGAHDGMLATYFFALEAYQTDNEDQFRATAVRLLASLPAKKAPLLGDWDFDELVYATGRQPRSKKKAMLLTFLRVLTGDLDRDRAIEMIQSL